MDDLSELNFDLSLLDEQQQQQLDQTANVFNSKRFQNVVNKDVNLLDTTWMNSFIAVGKNTNSRYTNDLAAENMSVNAEPFSDTDSLAGSSDVPSPTMSEEGQNFGFVNDSELLNLSVKELNGLVKRLPKDSVKEIKRRRRTLKNRGYAHSCRVKRLEEKSNLQRSKDNMEIEFELVKRQLMCMTAERDAYKAKYESFLRILSQTHGK